MRREQPYSGRYPLTLGRNNLGIRRGKKQLAALTAQLDVHHLEAFMQDVDSKWAEDLEKVPLFARSAETDLKKQWFAETYLSLLKDFIAKQ